VPSNKTLSVWNHKLSVIMKDNRDGSYVTKNDRSQILRMAGAQLHELGFQVNNPGALKPKHAAILVEQWKNAGLSAATIKNRTSHLRWLGRKTNNKFVKPTNDKYGIDKRVYVSPVNKSVDFTRDKLDKISNPYIRVSAELQKEFGLRREEAIKFQASFADRDSYIVIKPAWSKGGKGRVIPVTRETQREALNKAHTVSGKGSLIPGNSNYKAQREVFKKQMQKVELGKSHGARHMYAQARYQELTGYKCVHQGGEGRRYLYGDRKDRDTTAREIISNELGHERIGIVSYYLGG